MFVIKLKDEYLCGFCDSQGRHVVTSELSTAYVFTKEQAETVKAGDARLKEAQIIHVQGLEK